MSEILACPVRRNNHLCERVVYRHGAILLIPQELSCSAVSTTWRMMTRIEEVKKSEKV